ncbi:glycosyltransferase family 39 protein [Hymenobacter sp. HSC-4F20]|uniref:ArnT family glycosyltransferase n=1 Tax=Hymenobacter sp. HSC-4F20 TaxID=2864135 RepID=UPI001C730850|nr:glycosyltransferase family 39 protein [Hymenobacter sp. HSC-4F20]MBX0292551.1 glycosyltransferase family 39 protein [Hymenobacter sp. HSC-4F20]
MPFLSVLRARPFHIAALLLFIGVGLAFYVPFLGTLPVGPHAWAQADRLALAVNFYDYGFNFFKPRTSSLNSIGGITGVEFPLPSYLAALCGLVVGRENINGAFRAIDAAVAVVGFYYLFRLIYERTGHFVAALVPGAFLLSSPFFAFYAVSYLPDPVSLSLSFVGYYYWLRFFEQRTFRDLLVAVAVLTLAGLIKTTTSLHLAALVGLTLGWEYLAAEPLLTVRQRRQLLGAVLAGVGLIVAFFVHNQHLNATYQSGQFLAEARPITDDDVRQQVWFYIRRDWLAEYATNTQYRVLAVCGALLLVFAWPNLRRHLPLTLLLLATAAISYLFFQLMGAQMGVHDYYFICSFIPPAVLLLVLALLNIARYTGWVRYATTAGLAGLAVVFVVQGYTRLQRRMSDEYPPFSPYAYEWMRGGADLLRRAGVPPQAQVLLFNDPAPNLGLVYFDRRGRNWQYEVDKLTPDNLLDEMATDSLEYVLMAPAVYEKLAPQQEALNAAFEPLALQPAVVLRRRDMRRTW